eukprot:gb/GECH01007037.1/.p1 GENE.gb/GECH01007037.1/~~gb/GECH01007037.1/.p1  ORF type:complete len:511 (+),score=84.81 gb/GECH01007037.1/:1-1533(+)
MEHRGLSAALRLIDTDDFLGPENECIKPVRVESDAGKVSSIEVGPEGTYTQVNADGTRVPLEKTKIELADCLACSGCVTSAEEILVNEQSVDEFLSTIDQKEHRVVVTLSPQARAAISQHFGVSLDQTHRLLTGFLRTQLGVDHVYDSSWGRVFSLRETCVEFVNRYRQYASSSPSSRATEDGDKQNSSNNNNNRNTITAQHLPLICGVCPGWICYAEKSAHDVLPLISQVRSPQQMMGSLVPRAMDMDMDMDPGSSTPKPLYHVAIMPCYDKKLEASREDFRSSNQDNQREVDCVLTTGELMRILELRGEATDGSSFQQLPEAEPETPLTESPARDDRGRLCWGVAGQLTGSGGYLETVFRYAAAELFGVEVMEVPLRQGRNPDLHEAELEVDGKVVLRMAAAYGFRNIQNVLRKLRRKRKQYDYVEVMACPGGCVNGGGQLAPADHVRGRDHLKSVSQSYANPKQVSPTDIWRDQGIEKMYQKLCQDDLYTNYHPREKIAINPLSIKW